MKKILGTAAAIAALTVLGACSSGVEPEAPDAGVTDPATQTETYVEPETETPGAVEDGTAEPKGADEMAPVDQTEGAMEEPTTGEEIPADPNAEAPAEGGAAN